VIPLYDYDGNPIGTMQDKEAVTQWGKLFQERTLENGGIIGQDKVGTYMVSTVWLGQDHNWFGGPPVLWETMVFDDSMTVPSLISRYQRRYTSRTAAVAGHKWAVELARNGKFPEDDDE
jgi:hypothetical protein